MAEWGLVIGAIAAVGTLLGGIVSFLGWKKSQQTASPAPTQVAAENEAAVVGDGNFLARDVFIGTLPPAPQALPPPDPTVAPSSGGKEAESLPEIHEIHICESGPYEAGPGGWMKIDLDVEDGETIRGKIDADNDFEYIILDEVNYTKFRNNPRHKVAKRERGRRSYYIEWDVVGDGPWILLIGAPRKQYEREVWVYLRTLRQA